MASRSDLAARRARAPGLGLGVAGVLMLAFAAALLGFVVWAFFRLWALAGPVRMSLHGYIAMGLAAVFTIALGGGLMWLAFYSERRGYDDRVGPDPD
jgi:hypothetical protein